MSGFKTHRRFGIIVGGLISSLVFYFSLFEFGFDIQTTIAASAVAFLSTLIFSLIPDVDSQHSKPRQFLGTLSLIMALGGTVLITFFEVPGLSNYVFSFAEGLQYEIPTVILVFVWSFIGIWVLSIIVLGIFDKKTKHRGFFHSPAIYTSLGGLVILVSYLAMEGTVQVVMIIAGIGIISGFFTHYILDL